MFLYWIIYNNNNFLIDLSELYDLYNFYFSIIYLFIYCFGLIFKFIYIFEIGIYIYQLKDNFLIYDF